MSSSGGRGWGRPAVRNRRYDRLSALDPLEFERVVADYYRRIGFMVEHRGTGGVGGRFDGGIDLKMYRDGRCIVVQCKRENARQVTHNVGHELLGIMLTENADQAIVVNTGEFTPYAWESARKDPRLQLIDGDKLREMLPEYAVVDVPASGSPHGRAPLDWPLSGPLSRPAPGSVRYGAARNERDSNGVKALVALAFLVTVVVWQCSSRSDPERVASPEPAAPMVEPRAVHPQNRSRPEVPQPDSTPVANPSPGIDAREAQRRADEAMRVIQDTTPELGLLPDPHAVYRDHDPAPRAR
ncbi:restriction endonuclease [Luteimonas arsenica]|uniref:restriction endonuclease n=1 Tax=Luteimonas arsenica TaxID=1586242 RepID=UPI0010550B52|nr:restriction endonuclease [Luteimonas arsenica]